MKFLKIANSDKLAIVDEEDFDRVSKLTWRIKVEHVFRIKRVGNFNSKSISLASEIMEKPGLKFDHIDRNGLNNSKSNLRPCSPFQNNWNASKSKTAKSSKYKGCYPTENKKGWQVQICCFGKRINVGTFKTEVEAASAYNKKALELFKEFACLNKDEQGNIL
jgi:hypothetical protein